MAQRGRSKGAAATFSVWSVRLSLLSFACLVTLLCLFRDEVATGFSVVVGDWLDGRIQVSIAAHWYNVFRGLEGWRTTAYFYPWTGTLGYNDGYFINGLLSAPLRSFNVEPFLAFEIANIVIRGIGFLACALFAVDVLGLGLGWAILAAALFTLANNAYLQAGHSQLLTVSFAPLLAWLMWRAWRALRLRSDIGAILWGGAAAVLYGAWLLTGFYMAWFFGLFLSIAGLAAAALEFAGLGAGWQAWRPLSAWPLVPVIAVLAISIAPFLLVYLPKLGETGAHAFPEVLHYSLSPLDLLHVGSGNLLWGRLDGWLTQTLRPGVPDRDEHTVGFPLVFALLAIAGAISAWRRRTPASMIWPVIALSTAASLVLLVHVGQHTFWYGIYRIVPGAGAVRVVSRDALLLAFPATMLAVGFLAARAPQWPAWLTAACIAVLLVEQLNSGGNASLARAAQMRLVRDLPPAPASCHAFFVQTPRDYPSTGSAAVDALYPHNVDAMFIAEMLALPTLNGFSTFNPPDQPFRWTGTAEYLVRVRHYLMAHHLARGVCGLDLRNGTWIVNPFDDES